MYKHLAVHKSQVARKCMTYYKTVLTAHSGPLLMTHYYMMRYAVRSEQRKRTRSPGTSSSTYRSSRSSHTIAANKTRLYESLQWLSESKREYALSVRSEKTGAQRNESITGDPGEEPEATRNRPTRASSTSKDTELMIKCDGKPARVQLSDQKHVRKLESDLEQTAHKRTDATHNKCLSFRFLGQLTVRVKKR